MDFLKDKTPDQIAKATELFKKCGSHNEREAMAAQEAVFAELITPLRKGVLTSDIITDIFTKTNYDVNAVIEYPIDFYRPDNAGEYVAYVAPGQGAPPHRVVEGDYVTVPTYEINNSIDFKLQYAREARWDIVGRALAVLKAGFIKKINDDGWHTILQAGYDRNIVASDSDASAGQFTKKLVSLMQLIMRRNAGGNSNSMNRGRLTHLCISPEAMEDIRNWGVDQIDEISRREIYVANDGSFNRIFNVDLVDLDELGEGQEYQDYYANTIVSSGTGMAAGDVEIVVGLDLSTNDSFVMPVREELEIHTDATQHRAKKMSFYAWMTLGFAVLDGRRVLLGSL